MGGCLSSCQHESGLSAAAPPFRSFPETPAASDLVPVKAHPLIKGRKLRQTAIDSLLFATTSPWREKLNALAGKHYSLVSLFIYSSDFSHAVSVHSAGTIAHLVPPGLVLAACPGSSHAMLLEGKKPLVHTQTVPLDPLPIDWFTLEAFEDADTFLLVPLRRAGQVYGGVLVCGNDGEMCSCLATCEDDRRAVQAMYDLDELELLSQYLSVGLLTSPTDLEVLQVVANAATMLQRSLTIQDAVASLAEAVTACVRLSTRLDLECLPAVAFRGCHAAAFFRTILPPGQQPIDILAVQKAALVLQHQQHAAAGGVGGGGPVQLVAALRSQSRVLGSSTKWLPEDAGVGGACSLVASAVSLHGAPPPEQGADASVAAGAPHSLPHSHQQQRALLQAGLSGGATSSGGGGIRSRLASTALPRDGGAEPTGTQSPRCTMSLPLPAAVVAPGAKVRAITTLLNQTLLAQHLDLIAAAVAAATAASGGGGGTGTDFTSNSTSDPVARDLGPGLAAARGTATSTGGSRLTAGSRLLPHSPEAIVSALAGGAGCGGSAVSHGSEAAAAAAAAAVAADSRRLVSVAVVPNTATFLMADERQPYKDILHVQRMLPQARAHSMVMAVGGALERPQLPYSSNESQPAQGSGGAAGAAAAATPHSSLKLMLHQQQRQARGGLCAAALVSHGSAPETAAAATATAALHGGKRCSDSGRVVLTPAAAVLAAGALSSASNRTVAAAGAWGEVPTGSGATCSGPAAAAQQAVTAAAAACPAASLALYLVSSESVPRVILEQVAEEARQLLQMLHRPLACALTGPYLAPEWTRFTLLVLSKAAAASGGSAAAATAAAATAAAVAAAAAAAPGGGGGGLSVSCASARPSSLLASAVHSLSHLHPGVLEASSQTHCSADITCEDPTTVSVALDGPAAAGANTGTLSMMISSMRDVLSTVQLERSPDFRPASLEDIYAVRLLKVIGRGGQGMVFQGQMYNTVVAVKIIPSSDDADTSSTNAGAAGGGGGGGGGDAAGAAAAPAAPQAVEAAEAAQKLQQRQKRWLVRDALEVAVTSTISHPHIVQVLNFFTDALVVEYSNEHGRYRLMPREDSPSAKGASNTAIVMEYCDAGTLKHAVDNGCFRLQLRIAPQAGGIGSATDGAAGGNGSARAASGSSVAAAAAALAASAASVSGSHAFSQLNHTGLIALLTSLLEVAAGLRHLHENRLVHCDIKPSNVLLRSCTADVRGWVCKLSDFGCVRLMNVADPATGRPTFHSLSPVGSLSYMAPESMFRDTYLDSSIDIYSFGIMMWECAMGQLPYSGVPAQQLPSLVRRGLRPSFHHSVPQEYRQIACMCWAQDPRRRPTAAALVQLLQRMLSHTFEEAEATEALLAQQQQHHQHQPLLNHHHSQQQQAPSYASPFPSRKPLPPLPPSPPADHGPTAAFRPKSQPSCHFPPADAPPMLVSPALPAFSLSRQPSSGRGFSLPGGAAASVAAPSGGRVGAPAGAVGAGMGLGGRASAAGMPEAAAAAAPIPTAAGAERVAAQEADKEAAGESPAATTFASAAATAVGSPPSAQRGGLASAPTSAAAAAAAWASVPPQPVQQQQPSALGTVAPAVASKPSRLQASASASAAPRPAAGLNGVTSSACDSRVNEQQPSDPGVAALGPSVVSESGAAQ